MYRKIFSRIKTARYTLLTLLPIAVLTIVIAQTNTVSVTATFDPTGPNTVQIQPIPQYVPSSVTINWTPASNAVIYTAELSVDNSFTTILDSISTSSTTAVFSSLPEGILLYIRVTPYDSNGYPGIISNIVSTTSDVTPPVSSIISAVLQNDNSIQINYIASDTISGVQNVYLYYRLNEGAWINHGDIYFTSPYYYFPQQSGKYEFFTIAKDVRGNIEVKAPSPEATITVSSPVIPTPSIPLTTTPVLSSPIFSNTIFPTKTPIISPTITPNNDGISMNIELISSPFSTINILENKNIISKKSTDSGGKLSFTIKYSKDTLNLLALVYDRFGNNIYSKFFQTGNTYKIIVPPVFDNYYFTALPNSTIQLHGFATPGGEVKIFIPSKNGEYTNSVTTADYNGEFSFNIYSTTLNKKNFEIYATQTYEGLVSIKSNFVLLIITTNIPTNTQSGQTKDVSLIEKLLSTPLPKLLGLSPEVIQNIITITISIIISANILLGLEFLAWAILNLRYLISAKELLWLIKKSTKNNIIFDSKTKKPVPFANINLYSAEGQIIKVLKSNMMGEFYIDNIEKNKSYYYSVDHSQYIPINKSELYNSDKYIYTQGLTNNPETISISLDKKNNSLSINEILYNIWLFINIQNNFLLKLTLLLTSTYFLFTYDTKAIFVFAFMFVVSKIIGIYLFSRGVTLSLISENNSGFIPTENVTVQIYRNNKKIDKRVITDKTGDHIFHLPTGKYRIEILKSNLNIDSIIGKAKVLNQKNIIINTNRKNKAFQVILKQ